MLYLIALLIPPLGVFLIGRPITAIIMALVWIISLPFTFGSSHILFVIIAWLIIFQTREDRRANRLIRESQRNRDELD